MFIRYILKRRFDRGSYGEVWLAFHWNCSYDVDMPTKIKKNQFHSFSNFRLDQHNFNSSGEPSFEDPSDGNFFILKRIMVSILVTCLCNICFFFSFFFPLFCTNLLFVVSYAMPFYNLVIFFGVEFFDV